MLPKTAQTVFKTAVWGFLSNSSLLLIPSLVVAFEPSKVTLPYQEKGTFLSNHGKAYEYSFSLEAGQTLSIELEAPVELYPRLWEMGSNNRVKNQITFPLQEDLSAPVDYRHFILELRGEKDNLPFKLTISGKPFLLFPVQGKTQDAITSLIGDLRDEGIRLHEGLDVEAPRKTPLLAVKDGIISDMGTSERGGKFVMLRDSEYGIHYYYAHMNSQNVKEGQNVKRGDMIGTVGDTGNAKKGDYHLHFGIYDRRFTFINPYHYIASAPLKEALDFEGSFTFPLPFNAWVIVKNQCFLIQREEEGFFLKKESPLLVVGNSSQGTKIIFNQSVVYLNLQDLSDYAKTIESDKTSS